MVLKTFSLLRPEDLDGLSWFLLLFFVLLSESDRSGWHHDQVARDGGSAFADSGFAARAADGQ